MKLGIDISQIVYKGTGVARFTEGLVESILNYDTQNEWTFFFSSFRLKIDDELKKKILNKGYKLVEWNIPPKFLSYLWNDLHTLPLLNFNVKPINKLDWFITSDWTEPPLQVKKATIVHDLVFKRYPETVHKTILHTHQQRLKWVTKESHIIFADSYSTAKDLQEFYKIEPKKIIVNYPGVDTSPIKPNQNVRKAYLLDHPFILTVGKLEPRKNLKRLIEAYLAITDPNKPQLVIVGMKGWETEEYNNENIRYLGFISDEDLAALYKEALFFVLPSLYEGFGYPVVEAMSYGCPVAASDTSSIKEIVLDNALTFDPLETESIQKALEKMITDDNLRKNLSEKGKKRSSLITWKKYYETLIKSLSNAV